MTKSTRSSCVLPNHENAVFKVYRGDGCPWVQALVVANYQQGGGQAMMVDPYEFEVGLTVGDHMFS